MISFRHCVVRRAGTARDVVTSPQRHGRLRGSSRPKISYLHFFAEIAAAIKSYSSFTIIKLILKYIIMSPAQTRSAKKRSSASGQEAPAKARKVENGAPGTKDTPPKPEILETGILDYFIRARVGIEDPKNVDDIARGYLVLRPLRQDTDLTKRPLPDSLTSRLLAMPKKHLPQSSSDRFMAFVDEPGLSYSELASGFLASREYETKTMGERHVPSATPVGEGVYAITASGSESHLVYISTLPESKGEFQQSLGLQERGSFIICTKNPKFKSPPYAKLPEAPEYPKRSVVLAACKSSF